MPTVSALTLYPVKSCAGISVQSAKLTESGLSHESVFDREWMVVDENGHFLTQREHPVMARIRPALENATLVLRSPGFDSVSIALNQDDLHEKARLQVQVWDDTVLAADEGDAIAFWLSEVIGVACRLVRFHPMAIRKANNHWTSHQDVATRFADAYPILLTSEASLADLNQRLRNQSLAVVPMNRFRPNIVIDGIEAFEEEYAASLTQRRTDDNDESKGAICLTPIKPCARCPMPAVDQVTGEVGPNPVDVLQTYRSNALLEGAASFGMNVILTQGAGRSLSVGEQLELHIAF